MIKANLETGKLEMKGIEPILYAEVGMVVKGLYKVIKENNPENPHLARTLIERLIESATMTDEEVESELKRYESECPDLSIMASILIDAFTGR